MARAGNNHRLARLEERQAERRARSSQRDEDQVAHEAVMEKIRESPAGLEAVERYSSTMEAADGSIQDALQTEAGRDAVGRFGAIYIRTQAARKEQR